MELLVLNSNKWNHLMLARSAGAAEYTDCTFEDSLNDCSGFDIKQSDGEVPVKLELWGVQSIPLLPSLPGPPLPGVVLPDRSLSMG